MGREITDLDHMMKTLSAASTDPNGVSVGEFAKAIQSLQAELTMLEKEVDRLGGTVGVAFGARDDDSDDGADHMMEATTAAVSSSQAAATKP